MFAQLGSIVFENLMGFTEFSKTSIANYGEHNLLDGKPRLQYTGLALDTIDLSIKLHASFCNPSQQLALLVSSKDSGEVLPLLWGNGKVEGSFVITEIDTTMEDADSQGNVFSYELRVSLKEYVAGDKLKHEQQTNRTNAKAVGHKKPTAQKKTNPSTCPQTVSRIVMQIKNYATHIDYIIYGNYSKDVAEYGPGKVVYKYLFAIYNLCDDLVTNAKLICLEKYPDVRAKAQAVGIRAKHFAIMTTGDLITQSQLPNENKAFQQLVRELETAAMPLIKQGITRTP